VGSEITKQQCDEYESGGKVQEGVWGRDMERG
jgi:hypothetical protein